MTVAQIIDEIRSLSPEAQAGVVRFGYQLEWSELSPLAERLVTTDDPLEASRVRETVVGGFYGTRRDA